jgi:hypothetical protein
MSWALWFVVDIVTCIRRYQTWANEYNYKCRVTKNHKGGTMITM